MAKHDLHRADTLRTSPLRMSSPPDSWPPTDALDFGSRPVPLFPLPGVFFFPGQILPLHIFEPRYRAMIDDSLDGPGRLVIATVAEKDRAELASRPPVFPIAGIGEIARHEKLADGRYFIWLCGLCRVRLEEVQSEHAYRRARVSPLPEIVATDHEDGLLRPGLIAAIEKCTGTQLPQAEEIPLGALSDVLAQCLCVPEAVMAAIHGEIDVAERARRALAAADRFPARRRS